MRTVPPPLLNSYVPVLALDLEEGTLQFVPLVCPKEIDLFLTELILAEERNHPGEHFTLVRIIKIVVIVVRVGVLAERQGRVFDIGYCSDL